MIGKTRPTYPLIGSSLNIPITVKIIALTNITVIETSVLALYPLVDYLIINPPLLYAPHPGDPPTYILIEFSPNIICIFTG